MGDTDIGWTHRPGTRGRSWNPVQGCSRKSEGCRNCYAERMAARFAEKGWSQGLINLRTRKWNGVVRLAPQKLADPLRWREPSTVFVNSMSDMFHENLANETIAAVFGVMAACPKHTFIVLTKRPDRMREWYQWLRGPSEDSFTMRQRDIVAAPNTARALLDAAYEYLGKGRKPELDSAWALVEDDPWPLPNVWLGTSVENQEALDERWPHLMATPATLRLFSAEPLLGPLDFTHAFADAACRKGDLWVIDGCESGPGARPAKDAWFESNEEQCRAANVTYFRKQQMTDGRLHYDFPGRQEFPR